MQVMAAFCPPDDLVDELCAAIAGADDALCAALTTVRAELSTQRRWFGRTTTPVLDLPPHEPCVGPWLAPILPVVRFGNLTAVDSRRVAEMLTEVSATWTPPTVNFSGVQCGTEHRPRSIEAILGGEADELSDIARAVARHAAGLNLYVDRRLFSASFEIAIATDAASADHLVALTARLADFRGRTWAVDRLSILKNTFGEGSSNVIEEFAIPIGPA